MGGLDSFMVTEVRRHIDETTLWKGNISTRWIKYLHHKVNVFYWYVRLNEISTRVNLDVKGFDIPSMICGICDSDM